MTRIALLATLVATGIVCVAQAPAWAGIVSTPKLLAADLRTEGAVGRDVIPARSIRGGGGVRGGLRASSFRGNAMGRGGLRGRPSLGRNAAMSRSLSMRRGTAGANQRRQQPLRSAARSRLLSRNALSGGARTSSLRRNAASPRSRSNGGGISDAMQRGRGSMKNAGESRRFKPNVLAQSQGGRSQGWSDESHHHGSNSNRNRGRRPLPVGVNPGDPYHRMLDRMFPGQYDSGRAPSRRLPRPTLSDPFDPRLIPGVPQRRVAPTPAPTPEPVHTHSAPPAVPAPLATPSPTPSPSVPGPFAPNPSPQTSAPPMSPQDALDALVEPFLDDGEKVGWHFNTFEEKKAKLREILGDAMSNAVNKILQNLAR